MIKNSFIFLDKISHRSEKKIWEQKIHTWDHFLEAREIQGIGKTRKIFYDQQIHYAKTAITDDNAQALSALFPKQEHWRLYDLFKSQACFLDIETSGYYGDITVVGIYDGRETKTMVKGINLNPLLLNRLLQHYKMIITFNGASFDLPVINKYYPNTIPHVPHIDLRHPLAKLGYSGGLKSIEAQLGIRRAEAVQGISGSDAVYLWNMYKATGKREYLERLVQYNEEDIINLKPLADFVFKEMKRKVFEENVKLNSSRNIC
jgi:uncharacterized protein YprB with RNaseH-like and TPR domain